MGREPGVQLPVAVTLSGAAPVLGTTLSVQAGGCAGPTVTVWVFEPDKPLVSVAVTVTVKVPGEL